MIPPRNRGTFPQERRLGNRFFGRELKHKQGLGIDQLAAVQPTDKFDLFLAMAWQ